MKALLACPGKAGLMRPLMLKNEQAGLVSRARGAAGGPWAHMARRGPLWAT